MIVPPALAKNATIAVVAPSGPFDSDRLRDGLARLESFQLKVPEGLWGRRSGYFAGSDQERLSELQAAFDDPRVKAVLVARGGFGLSRIVDKLDWRGFRQAPKWVVGFSDTTVLHATLWTLGISSIHGPNGTTLAQASERDLQSMLDALEGRSTPSVEGISTWVSGTVTGPLLGGNLTVLFTEAAAGRLRIPDGALIFLEDVTETSYRVDRMLDALRAGGYFERCAGLIFGEFTNCSPGKFEVPVQDVLRQFALRLGLPCGAELPVGHGDRNRALTLGRPATLRLPDQGTGSLQFENGETPVS